MGGRFRHMDGSCVSNLLDHWQAEQAACVIVIKAQQFIQADAFGAAQPGRWARH